MAYVSEVRTASIIRAMSDIALMMETASISKISVMIYQTIWRLKVVKSTRRFLMMNIDTTPETSELASN
jgi:hypothetical protein